MVCFFGASAVPAYKREDAEVIRGAYLLIKDVPYVNQAREVRRGILIASRERNESGKPATHVAHWTGEHPCHHTGALIDAFSNASPPQSLGEGI
jgi:hypothetical protein